MTDIPILTLPPINAEQQTRRVVVKLMENLDGVPIYLVVQVRGVRFGLSHMGKQPFFTLELMVLPPSQPPGLVPFKCFVSRAFIAPNLPGDPFWFEDALGRIEIPWGEALTRTQLRTLFNPWMDKQALARIGLISYHGANMMRIEGLQPKGDVE